MPRVARAALHTALAVVGGYGLVSLAVTLSATLLARGAMQPADAIVTAAMLGFPAYLVVLLWAFACDGTVKLVCWLGGAAVLMVGLAWRLGVAAVA